MIIKFLLIIPLTFLFLFFLKNSGKSKVQAWKKILFILFLLFGLLSVIQPDIIDGLAKLLGIGRGADLLLYALTVSFIFVVINVYIKFKEISLRQDKIISKLAILEKNNEE